MVTVFEADYVLRQARLWIARKSQAPRHIVDSLDMMSVREGAITDG